MSALSKEIMKEIFTEDRKGQTPSQEAQDHDHDNKKLIREETFITSAFY